MYFFINMLTLCKYTTLLYVIILALLMIDAPGEWVGKIVPLK